MAQLPPKGLLYEKKEVIVLAFLGDLQCADLANPPKAVEIEGLKSPIRIVLKFNLALNLVLVWGQENFYL